MTHPITPTSELIELWTDLLATRSDEEVFTLAARWGANEELDACCEALENWNSRITSNLRAARRPKLKSVKEYALDALDTAILRGCLDASTDVDIILRALEQLDD